MSGVFGAVMEQLSLGASPRAAARHLGISADLANAVAEEATRMGLVVSGGAACGTCVPKSSPACAGCPFTAGVASGDSRMAVRPAPHGGPTPVTLGGPTPLTLVPRRSSR